MCNCGCGCNPSRKTRKTSKKNRCKGGCCSDCGCGPIPPCPPVPRQSSLLVTVTPSPLIVTPGNIITISVAVTTVGNFPAVDTRLLIQLPASNIFTWRTASVSCQPLATLNSISFRCPAGTIFPGSSRIAIFQALIPPIATQITYPVVATAIANNADQVSAHNSFTVSTLGGIGILGANLLGIDGQVVGNPITPLGPFVGSGLGGLTGGPLVL